MERSTNSLTYKGSIPDAINQSKRRKKLFVVYLSGEDETSSNLEQSILVDENVMEVICRYCIFLHLKHGNVDASQFSAIYPQNSIPSFSVIGLNGVMLWHHEGYISSEDLKGNIEKAWAVFHLQETAATLLTASLASEKFESVNSPSAPPTQGSSSTSDYPSTSSEQSTITSAHSTGLMEQLNSSSHNEHLNVSEKGCSTSDNVRGGVSVEDKKDSASAKGDSALPDCSKSSTMDCLEDLNKRDHTTSLQGDNKVDEGCATVSSESAPTTAISRGVSSHLTVEQEKETSATAPSASTKNSVKSNDIQLSIRTLTGPSLQIKLKKEDILRSVKNFVDENQGGGVGSYDLAIPYPRKLFTEQDMETTLGELGFESRQALIVVPRRQSVQLSRLQSSSYDTDNNTNTENLGAGGYFGYLRTVLSFVNPFSYFRGNPTSTSNSEPLPTEGLQHYGPYPGGRNLFATEGSSQRQHLPNNGSQTATDSTGNSGRRQSRPFGGNIHTLRSDDEGPSGDRNVFWNGNSTQFGGDDKK